MCDFKGVHLLDGVGGESGGLIEIDVFHDPQKFINLMNLLMTVALKQYCLTLGKRLLQLRVLILMKVITL